MFLSKLSKNMNHKFRTNNKKQPNISRVIKKASNTFRTKPSTVIKNLKKFHKSATTKNNKFPHNKNKSLSLFMIKSQYSPYHPASLAIMSLKREIQSNSQSHKLSPHYRRKIRKRVRWKCSGKKSDSKNSPKTKLNPINPSHNSLNLYKINPKTWVTKKLSSPYRNNLFITTQSTP